MPLDREEAGVGRGNGLGSRGTQFGNGQPTNRGGRKKKERVSPSQSLSQAVLRLLGESERVKEGGRYVELSRFDLLARTIFQGLDQTDFKERLALLTAISKLPPVPVGTDAWEWRPPADINDVLADLAAEYEAELAHEEQLRQGGVC